MSLRSISWGVPSPELRSLKAHTAAPSGVEVLGPLADVCEHRDQEWHLDPHLQLVYSQLWPGTHIYVSFTGSPQAQAIFWFIGDFRWYLSSFSLAGMPRPALEFLE